MTTIDRLVNRSDLAQALILVEKHTIPEKEVKLVSQFEVFRCVLVEFHRTYLTVTTTNRHTICEDAVPSAEDRHTWQRDDEVLASCLVHIGDLQAALKVSTAGRPKKEWPKEVSLTFNPDQRADRLVLDYEHEMPTQDWCRTFPKIKHLIRDDYPEQGSIGFDVDMDMMALFARKFTARAGEENLPLKVHLSGENCGDLSGSRDVTGAKRTAVFEESQPPLWARGKPMQVRFGNHMRGCVMLMRPGSGMP